MSRLTRRDLLVQSAAGVFAALGASACQKKEFSCSGAVGLTPDDLGVRTTLGYVDRSPDKNKACSTCTQFVSVASDECGTCKVMKGPTHPEGSCKSYAAK